MTETGADDDPSDDATHWVGNLPESDLSSIKRADKRPTGGPEQSDVQRKELPVEEG